jgi:hypothetical protein
MFKFWNRKEPKADPFLEMFDVGTRAMMSDVHRGRCITMLLQKLKDNEVKLDKDEGLMVRQAMLGF